MLFLNPPKHRRRTVRRKRRKLAGAALKAHLKKIGRRKRRKVSRRTARRGANARRISRGGVVAKRKRRRSSSRRHVRRSHRRKRTAVATVRLSNPRRRRRNPRHLTRHRRRNPGRYNPPGFSINSLKSQAIEGVKGGAGVLLGEAGTNIIAGFIPVAKTGVVGYLVKGAAAVATGFVVHKAAGPNLARYALAGGFASILRGPLKALNIPMLSSNLGAYPMAGLGDAGGAYAALGAGPEPGSIDNGMGGYADMGYGDGMDAYPMN